MRERGGAATALIARPRVSFGINGLTFLLKHAVRKTASSFVGAHDGHDQQSAQNELTSAELHSIYGGS